MKLWENGKGVRDENKGITSYWKTIFKNQYFSCIYPRSFFFFVILGLEPSASTLSLFL
jgi:hypothetical protein